MNESEMHRRELLKQARRLYEDRREIPAVHPRYGRIYHDLYPENKGMKEQTGGSFYLRLVIGILCFICFVYMDQSSAGVAEVNSDSITEEIGKDLDLEKIAEVWKEL